MRSSARSGSPRPAATPPRWASPSPRPSPRGSSSQEDLVAVLAVGPSGAGRSTRPDLSASELLGSAHAYAVGGTHRHTPEILQNLALVTGVRGTISFTPVLVPMARGILATCTATLAPDADERRLRAVYEEAYGGERFVPSAARRAGSPRSSTRSGRTPLLLGLARRRGRPPARRRRAPSTTSSRARPAPRSSRRTSPSACRRRRVSPSTERHHERHRSSRVRSRRRGGRPAVGRRDPTSRSWSTAGLRPPRPRCSRATAARRTRSSGASR